jgi:hypothetical protein
MRAAVLAWCAVAAAVVRLCGGGSCYPLQEGAIVDGRSDVPLAVCLPRGVTLNCDHCTHAGSRTACWKLNSRCLSMNLLQAGQTGNLQNELFVQNWGWGIESGRWQQNWDLKGNFASVEAVCQDQYQGLCFTEQDVHSAGRASWRVSALLGLVPPLSLLLR